MSSFTYKSIPGWATELDLSHHTSAFPEHREIFATYCAFDSHGDAAYFQDIRLMMRSNVPIPFGDSAIYGMIAEPKDKAISRDLIGKDLITAAWPMSRGWFDRGTFKLGFKDNTSTATAKIADLYQKDEVALSRCFEKYSRNPYDTRRDVATAVIVDPYTIDAPKSFILGRDSYFGSDGGRRSPRKLIAICDGFESLRNHLLLSPLLLEMIEATYESKDLFTRYHQDLLKIISVSNARGLHSDNDLEKLRSKYRIFDEIANSELAGRVMEAAIDIALAGPESFEEFRTCLDETDRPKGRKLIKHRARDVYLQIYWNLWKRVGTSRRSIPAGMSFKDETNLTEQRAAFLDHVSAIEHELESSTDRIEDTANDFLEAYISSKNEPEVIVGDGMSEIHLVSEANQSAASEGVFFCLNAAAILRHGYRSKALIAALTELTGSDIGIVKKSAQWAVEIT